MSSQGSSSARAVSGTAFGPMSGDPLSRDVSTPSTSSTKSVPKVASHPVDREAAEPKQEAVSTSGRQVNDEAEEVAVSYGDLESLITSDVYVWIARMYGLQVIEPTDLERPHTPPIGHVTLSERYLQFRMRFPLNPFFIEIFQYFSLTVFQITPNGRAHMIELFGLFAE